MCVIRLSGMSGFRCLVLSQRILLDLDAVLGDDVYGDRVAAVNVSLGGRDERVSDDRNGLLFRLVCDEFLVEHVVSV